MTTDPDFIDLEPQPSASLQPTAAATPAQQRQIAERAQDIQILLDVLPDLRLNKLTSKMEYGPRSNPTVLAGDDLETLCVRLAVEKQVYIPEQRIRAAVKYAASMSSFCPIRRYLMECCYKDTTFPEWDNLGPMLIGSDLPMATTILQRWLVGAVARAYEPGCSMSWVPIFIGAQGCGKSQLIRELVPKDLFAEISVSMDILVKEIYRLHVAWLIELPEIDNFFSVKNIENFKNLITTRTDETRLPYQSLPISLDRQFVLAGTSNRSEFLVDSTGNRRFIPLEVGEGFETPWRQLSEFRDRLWKRAVEEYQKGLRWEITSGEVAGMAEYISQFTVTDPWELLVGKYVETKEEVTTTEVLINGLSFSAQVVSTRDSKRVSAILTKLGWRRMITSRKGKSVRLWKRPKPLPEGSVQSLGDF